MEFSPEHPEKSVRHILDEFVATSPQNRLTHIDGAPMFSAPLVGFASGDDPMFLRLKTAVGAFHLTPGEAAAAAGRPVTGALSVIAYILPVHEGIRASNRAQTAGPSQRWAHMRNYGEPFNDAVRQHLVELLRSAGHMAVAPVAEPFFKIHSDAPAYAPASNWSERHIAFVAGLGTFGLSDGLITPVGMAMRCGSVITNLALTPTPRTYESHTAYCPFLVSGTCGACIERCPAGAISEAGHDKQRCNDYMRTHLADLREREGLTISGCGLCQTGVPCEAGIPTP